MPSIDVMISTSIPPPAPEVGGIDVAGLVDGALDALDSLAKKRAPPPEVKPVDTGDIPSTASKGGDFSQHSSSDRSWPNPDSSSKGTRGRSSPRTGPKRSLSIAREQVEGGWRIRLTGVIDESLDKDNLVEGLSGTVVFDLDAVGLITDSGVREWMAALPKIDASYYGFIKCRPSIVSQFNTVASFGGSGELVSFYAPYSCPSCQFCFDRLIDLRQKYEELQRAGSPEGMVCPVCASDAEFDESPEDYFDYVLSRPKPVPPPLVAEVIDGTAKPTKFKIDKDLEGPITALWLSGPLDKKGRFKRMVDGLEGEVLMVLGALGPDTQEGFESLSAFLKAPETSVLLARIPESLIKQLSQKGAIGAARVLSVWLPFECAVCGREAEMDVDSHQIASLVASGTIDVKCRHCKGALRARASSQALLAAVSLPWADPSAALKKYLSARPGKLLLPGGSARGAKNGGAGQGRSFGDYEILRSLAKGGMGEVFLARKIGPEGFQKKVVLKCLLPQYAEDKSRLEMFLQEAKLVAQLSHPNIVQTFDLGKFDDRFYMAMEYVEGHDLLTVLRKGRKQKVALPMEIACWMVSEIAAALHAAHSHHDEGRPAPVVHRDVSPQNILISREGVVKLADFGVAKVVQDVSNQAARTTSFVGKLSYTAPERITDPRSTLDGRCDIFSLGVILWESLTMRPCFQRANDAATINAILNEAVPPPSSIRTGLPQELDQIVAKATSKSPDSRYATARELGRELKLMLAQLGLVATAGDLSEFLRALFPE
jgi:tRNA A-37 threonylcarbamoyl transferase component Bud32